MSTTAATMSYRESFESLRRAQKSNVGAPGYSRWVNRPVGRVLSSAANVIGATPNQLTLASAVLSASALLLVALVPVGLGLGILIAALLLLGYALDSADGQLARLRGGGSLAGEFLDHVVDCAKTSSVHLVILIQWYRFFDVNERSTVVLFIPIAFSIVSSVWFFALILADLLRRSRAHSPARRTLATSGNARIARSIFGLPADYGVLALTFVLLSFQPVFIAVYTGFLLANFVFLGAKLVSWYCEMRSLDVAA